MRAIAYLVAGVTATTLAACQLNIFGSDAERRYRATESFTAVLDASDDVSLNLENINGNLSIVGDPAATEIDVTAEIEVRATSSEEAEDYLALVSVQVADVGDEIRIRTDHPSTTSRWEVTVDYALTVPDYLVVRVVAVNGEVRVRSIDEAVTISNVNGSIDVADVVGDVDATLVNGDVDVGVTLLSGGHADLSVVNGTIDLSVPTSVSAMLEAAVANGTVSIVGLTVTNATTTIRSVRGQLGGGDGRIELDATNGTITVRGR